LQDPCPLDSDDIADVSSPNRDFTITALKLGQIYTATESVAGPTASMTYVDLNDSYT